MLQELCRLLKDAFTILPRGGCVAFFSSFAFLNQVKQEMTAGLDKIFAEEREAPGKLLADFAQAARESKALLLAVVGGKVSEGINFKDDMCRLVLVCGLPYPNPRDPVLLEKMRFLDASNHSLSGKQFYAAKCMKGVNQSIGRAIRHRNDWAALILLDYRYAQPNILDGISTWLRNRMAVRPYSQIADEMREFFSRMTIMANIE